ncbi:hypothetical protein [Virgibacillus xinjiangensis]|uniref:hypothetical protein n=1 Tax=Virgibacillus xinjiangensis TaxID=393090 RepID=UPI0036F439BF
MKLSHFVNMIFFNSNRSMNFTQAMTLAEEINEDSRRNSGQSEIPENDRPGSQRVTRGRRSGTFEAAGEAHKEKKQVQDFSATR